LDWLCWIGFDLVRVMVRSCFEVDYGDFDYDKNRSAFWSFGFSLLQIKKIFRQSDRALAAIFAFLPPLNVSNIRRFFFYSDFSYNTQFCLWRSNWGRNFLYFFRYFYWYVSTFCRGPILQFLVINWCLGTVCGDVIWAIVFDRHPIITQKSLSHTFCLSQLWFSFDWRWPKLSKIFKYNVIFYIVLIFTMFQLW